MWMEFSSYKGCMQYRDLKGSLQFHHAEDGNIMGYKARFMARDIDHEGLGYDALLSRHGGVAECRWNLLGTREVCSRDPEEVQDDELQGHDHTYGIEPETIE